MQHIRLGRAVGNKNINPSTVRGKYILISTNFNRYNPAINIVWC